MVTLADRTRRILGEVLSNEIIAEHLMRHYGIDGGISRIPQGRADNYQVVSRGEHWLLKVFQPEYDVPAIERASAFLQFVTRAGYPAKEFVRSLSGSAVVLCGNRASVLLTWIDGNTPEPNTVSNESMLAQIGALCGKVHALGADWPNAGSLGFSGSKRGLAQKISSLRRIAAVPHAGEEIAEEARVRIAILEGLGEALEQSYRRLSTGVIHGDFAAAHVVFREEVAVGVIDVVGENYLPGWELMRGFFQSVPCGDGPPDRLEPLWAPYFAGYQSEQRVEAQQVACAFDGYLYQLTGSTYGLRPPLDRGLRAFGRWRTGLARYLAANREVLRESMTSLARGN